MTIFDKLDKLQHDARGVPRDKFAYEWVQEVLKQPTKEGRRNILKCVPEDMRARVATKVEMEFQKRERQKK